MGKFASDINGDAYTNYLNWSLRWNNSRRTDLLCV